MPAAVCLVLQGPLEPVYRAALALGTANQLTNILRDVGEDLETRNRIYVPLDELHQVSCSTLLRSFHSHDITVHTQQRS